MNRRELLGGLSALFAAGLVLDDAEAAGPPPTSPQALERWLAALDQDLERMRARAPAAEVSAALREAGLPPRLMGETFATLTLFSAWRESDEGVRQHPAFQARLFRAADLLARRAVVMAGWMEGVDRARRRAIGALLSRPNRLMTILDHALIRKGERMNPARRRALRGTLGDLARATRRAGARPEAFLDELILFVDHAAREEGVDRHALAAQERAALARGEGTSATMETVEDVPAPSEPAPSEPAPSEPAPSEPAPSEPAPSEPALYEPALYEPRRWGQWLLTPEETVLLGLKLMGIGASVTVGGLLLSIALPALLGMGPIVLGYVFCLFLGPALLLTGLALVLFGIYIPIFERFDEEALLRILGTADPPPRPA
ncbi:hypothetical protein L6R49_06345 [Myxococcota bacterium]|nr:hypothetical protein [Myxococcota bacterium]